MRIGAAVFVAAGLVAGLAAGPARAGDEVIVIRTGQVGGVPGACGQNDDCFRQTSNPQCGFELSAAPFDGAMFAAAQAGPAAVLIDPSFVSVWAQTLACDPDARWINFTHDQCFPTPGSVLYACEFTVATDCGTPLTADVDVCWVVDDTLGDPSGGPNPIGVYVNGTALDPSFAGGNYATDTNASQTGVPVQTGSNWLYVYQRDAGCAVSGVMLSATVTVRSCATPTEETSWGGVKQSF